MATRIPSIGRLAGILAAVLSITGVYLYGWPAPSLPYIGTVLFHTGIGLLFLLLGLFLLRYVKQQGILCVVASAVLAIAGILGIVLMFVGATRPMYPLLFAHIIASVLGVVLLAGWWMGKRKNAPAWRYAAALIVVAIALGALSQYSRQSWSKQYQIRNPEMAPLTMDGEGDGPTGMFFPSSAQVAGKRRIPSKFFMESDACQRCHSDIYQQWQSSMHHMSSFNNQWYRKSIEYMQDVRGVKPSKWCGGCHDPAVLYSGLMDTPIKQIVHRPESQAGLGCMMCHSIVKVKSTMGQGDFMLEYPELHELAATKNPVMRWLHDFTIYLNPEPHRRVFLKPFMRNEQSPEFCSSCHKVHLDVPVNAYRWTRGFNEYDNWQASGISGFGARSFYYPAKSQQCVDCHMQLVPSNDAGNIDGKVHSHSFPAANTAVPFANHDEAQLKLEQDFLKNGNLSIDIFALSRVAKLKNAAQQSTDLSTTFAVGEEAEVKTNAVGPQETVPVTAPLNEVGPSVRPGDSVRIDVVVRTKKVGHFFPGGTVDAYDTWVELKAVDDSGKTLFWSGSVEDDGKGPVEKGAHFYKSLQIDEHGNQINKRNAWSTRAVAYVHLIPPGAADTVHYRLDVPANLTAKKITLSARLLYRKFSWYNTQFSFAGTTDEAPTAPQTTPSYDDRKFSLTGDTSDVSAKMKQVPDVPIVTVTSNTVDLAVAPKGSPEPKPATKAVKEEWQRWNDYGIGLFLQGDLKAAAAAFQKVTEADPKNPDGWVNLGRVAVQEGDMDTARRVLETALSLSPELARANFFYARVLRADGDYDGAIQRIRSVLKQYPNDRVVRNELGRLLFLQRKFNEAIPELQKALEIDPEDLQANYNLMLCYRGMGDTQRASEFEKRYLRFKADESAQALTGAFRRLHPEDNNERQAIHEHVSGPLSASPKTQTAGTSAANGKVRTLR